ncbi:MAG: AmmeMemoRadiSam system protein B [Lentisphaeria bacterium]|nr:AmmeMemoRadiSam system protein B [Lentisphaeria bacterium]
MSNPLTGGNAATVRPTAVAGSFYPGKADALRKEVQRLLDNAGDVHPGGNVLGAMAPHAGYVYSARFSAPVFKALGACEIDTVVIIGHDLGANAPGIVAVLSDVDAYETPLGQVPVDIAMVKALQDVPGIMIHNGIHAREHSIEVQLPFLQVVKPGVKIVPAFMGEVSVENSRRFVEALDKAAGGRRLFVLASTDLSHYPAYDDAVKLDQATMALVSAMDLQGLCERQAGKGVDAPNTQTAICAAGGVITALTFAQKHGVDEVKILARGNSGDARGGDLKSVVGYASAIFVDNRATSTNNQDDDKSTTTTAKATPNAPPTAEATPEFALSAAAQAELLTLARNRISAETRREKWSYRPPAVLTELQEPAAVFVTLTKDGQLRGCIGTTVAREPLWAAVEDAACAAAFEDNRFMPVQEDELKRLRVEISVLSPMQPVASADLVQPFKHGVLIRAGYHSGLFLPQVWEQLPDKEHFLSVLCEHKAGLPGDAWRRQDVKLFIFTVFAFHEQ